MTPEELMKPRYKVIADWPGNRGLFPVGEIIAKELSSTSLFAECDKYPHLFRKLEWWQDRQLEDFPKYVKRGSGKVFKIGLHLNISTNGIAILAEPDKYRTINLKSCQPATEEEYNQQPI